MLWLENAHQVIGRVRDAARLLGELHGGAPERRRMSNESMSPPNPAVNAELLARASTLRWVRQLEQTQTAPELGVFFSDEAWLELALVMVADDSRAIEGVHNRCRWEIVRSAGCLVPFLISRATFAMLHEGALGDNPDAFYAQGRAWRLEARWNGTVNYALAVPW
jgi:hypothetical protein